jgi:hypothetical protein
LRPRRDLGWLWFLVGKLSGFTFCPAMVHSSRGTAGHPTAERDADS